MFEMFGGWGDRIDWQNFTKRQIVGWKQVKPKVGDLIKCPMESGDDGLFRVTRVEHMHDPADMFFADTEPVSYLRDYKGKYTPEAKEKITFLK